MNKKLLWFFCNSVSLRKIHSFKSIYFVNNKIANKIENFPSMFYSTVPINSPGKSERETLLPCSVLDSAEGKKRDRKPVITFVTGNKKKYILFKPFET
jgi:hypothetical protein